MKITQADVDFWQAERSQPQWLTDHQTAKAKSMWVKPAFDIHACVNGHAGEDLPPRNILDASNLIVMLRHARRRKVTLAVYLIQLADNPGTIARPQRRVGYALKWAYKIMGIKRKRVDKFGQS